MDLDSTDWALVLVLFHLHVVLDSIEQMDLQSNWLGNYKLDCD